MLREVVDLAGREAVGSAVCRVDRPPVKRAVGPLWEEFSAGLI